MTRARITPSRTPYGPWLRCVRACLALAVVASGCAPERAPGPTAPPTASSTPRPSPPMKTPATIEIDLDGLDADGLRGPPDGKVAVDYEFAIPDTPEDRAAVRAIDATVEFHPGSRGRVGAGKGECLCIGSTHRADWRRVLESLAALPGVERIIECHRE